MSSVEVQEALDVGKTRFFSLLRDYLQVPEASSIA